MLTSALTSFQTHQHHAQSERVWPPPLGLQLPDPLSSPQRVSRDDRFVELGTAGGDAGLGLGLGDQRGDIGQYLGGQEGPGLLGLGRYFCLGGDLLDLPPSHPGLAIAQHHPHPGALGREETEIGRSHEESFREERKEEKREEKTTARAVAHLGAVPLLPPGMTHAARWPPRSRHLPAAPPKGRPWCRCPVDLAHLGEPAASGGVVTEKCTVLHLRSTVPNQSVRIGAMSTPPEPATPLPHGVFPIGDATDEAEQRAALEQQVLTELLALRKAYGQLTVQKFSAFATLRQVCGGDDLLDAFLLFQRELARYQHSGRNEAAAALSLSAPADTVLDRLQLTAEALSPEQDWRDQRTARRWSDAGMPIIARDLVYFAQVAGRLGTETLSIQLGGSGTSLMVIIDQMTNSDLPAKAPLIQVWHYPSSNSPRELTLDLEQITSPQVSRDGLTMRRHRLALDLPDTQIVEPDDAVLAVSITGQDTPMRTVFYQDHSHLTPGLHTRMTTYRTIVMVEVAKDEE